MSFSFIKATQVPSTLSNSYEILKTLKPTEPCNVEVYNKSTKTYYTKSIFRKYMSYGVSPQFNMSSKKSYMFTHQKCAIPIELLPILTYAKSIDYRYNNIYINWYDAGENYIEPHSDCVNQMPHEAKILLINFNEGLDERVLTFESKTDRYFKKEIPLTHGLVLEFDAQAQEEYRHGVPKAETREGRISVTFRMFNG